MKECPKCGSSLMCLESSKEHMYHWRGVCLTCGFHTQEWRETQTEAVDDWEQVLQA